MKTIHFLILFVVLVYSVAAAYTMGYNPIGWLYEQMVSGYQDLLYYYQHS